MKKRTKIVGAVLATVLTVSLVSVVAVSAEGRTDGRMGGMGRWGERPGSGIVEGLRDRIGGRMGGRMGATGGLAEALGQTQEELRAAFQDGKTIADLAEEKGMTLQELWDAVRAGNEQDHRQAIEDRVASGDLSQEKADWILEGLDNDWKMGMRNVRPARIESNPMELAADQLGLTFDELRLQLWGGATLEELFDDAGLNWDAYQQDLASAREQSLRDAIAQAVTDGDISADQADWLVRGLDAGYLATPQVSPGGPLMGAPRGGMRGPGGMRGGFHGEQNDSGFGGRGGMRGAPAETVETDQV